MIDLYEEFAVLIDALEKARAEYAVCGGLAMAIHGLPRATIDVDLIAPEKAGDQVLDIAHRLGYTISAEPMTFAAGAVPIRRVTKIDSTVHDRVGGGDGFASGFIYGLLSGESADEALKLGWAHGALLTTTPGDTTMVTLEQVKAFAKGGSARIQR